MKLAIAVIVNTLWLSGALMELQGLLLGVSRPVSAQEAPTDASYVTSIEVPGLSAEQALGALATGLLKNTTTTGQLSIATAPADYVATGDSRLSDARVPTTHAGSHVTGGSDVIANVVAAGNAGLITGADKTKLDGIATGAEVNVNADWSSGAGDSQILNKPSTFAPSAHATSHRTGGVDSIALDTLAAPTDITTLNATASLHGLLPKLSNVATQYLNGTGNWTVPPSGGPTTLTSTTLQSDAVIATYTAITGLAFTPLANTNYIINCFIRYTSTAATTGINFAWDVPASVNSIHMSGYTTTTAAGANEGFSQRADNVGTSTTAAVITVENVAVLSAQLRNGANATSTTLGFTPEIANSVSVVAGSTCQYQSY